MDNTNRMTTPSDAVRILLEAAIPERVEEFRKLWKEYAPSIEIEADSSGFTINANKRRILYQQKALDVLWIVGFSAWESIATYSPTIATALIFHLRLEDALKYDDLRGQYETEYKSRLASARAINDAHEFFLDKWPSDVPLPILNRESAYLEQAAAYDLTLMAIAFVLFHELRHVMLDRDNQHPPDDKVEELWCDIWAREFMTSNLAEYAHNHNHDYAQVLNKRASAMALGCLMLHEITPIFEHGGSKTHPPLGERIQAIAGNMNLPETATYWIFAACVLVGALRRQNRSLEITAKNPRELVEKLIDLF